MVRAHFISLLLLETQSFTYLYNTLYRDISEDMGQGLFRCLPKKLPRSMLTCRRGLVNTFGVYQTYYTSTLLSDSEPSSIAWIGSIQAFLLLAVGCLTGPLYDAGYFRTLMAAGTFFLVFGHMMLSLADKYWQVLLAQGFCIGLGPGFLFVPSVAILSQYFRRRIALSMGIAAAGSSIGGVLYPIVLHKMLPEVGWGWAVRTEGFIALATLIVPNTVMSVRALPDGRRKMWDPTALHDMKFILYTIASFIGFMGLYMVFYYIEGFAIDNGYTDANLGFYLLSILNAASTFGRVVPNFIADKIGPFNVFIPAAVLSGTLTLCAMAVTSKGGVIAVCALYGFASGAFVSIPPTIMVKICPHPGIIGTRMGMMFGFTSVGMLIGAPIGGAILRADGYNGIWIWGGVLMISGGLMTVTSRIAHAGWNPFLKV